MSLQQRYNGDTVVLFPNYHHPSFQRVVANSDTLLYHIVPFFRNYDDVKLDIRSPVQKAAPGDTITLKITFHNERPLIMDRSGIPPVLHSQFYQGNTLVHEAKILTVQQEHFNKVTEVSVATPAQPGRYEFHFVIKSGFLPPVSVSGPKTILITEL